MGGRRASKLLLIGWAGAGWKVINPLLDAGQLPTLDRLLDRGVMGDLAGLTPPIPELLWTSLATGVRADRHRVLGLVEFDELTHDVRPPASTSRRTKAVWNILSQSGLHSHAVNWPVSHPAEPLAGVSVSTEFARADDGSGPTWPLAADSVLPERLRATLADLRVHPTDLAAAHLAPFVPRAAEVDQDRDPRLAALAGALAECVSVHAAATWLLEHEPWDFAAVHYDLIGRLSPVFLRYHQSDAATELYGHVITEAYRFHDLILARLLQLAGPEAVVVLVSAGSPGILAVAGDGIRHDELLHGAGILDVAPTVLSLFGLPVGTDMEGRPLAAAFREPPTDGRIASWEAVAPERVCKPPEAPAHVGEALAELRRLGYAEFLGDFEQTIRRQETLTLARVLLDADRAAEAIPDLHELLQGWPADADAALLLAQCQLAAGRLAEARRVAAEVVDRLHNPAIADMLRGLIALSEDRGAEALACFRRVERTADRLADVRCQIGYAYLSMRRWADAERAFRETLAEWPDGTQPHFGLAIACLRQDRFEAAATAALDAVALRHGFADAHYLLGIALAQLGQPARAIQALETSLSLKPTLRAAHAWLANIHEQATGNWARAADHRRRAAELALEPSVTQTGIAYTC